MCKRKLRKNLYNYAKLYNLGLLDECELKKYLSYYIVNIANEEVYMYINKCLNVYMGELNYAK